MTKRQNLTGAEAIIATLRTYHVDTIFGIPGVHTLPIYEAIYQNKNIQHILARHEQGAGFMAEGYARVSGRPGITCTITGPGATNAATPIADAYSDSIPLLVISSSQARDVQNQGKGELHEVKDQLGMMSSLAGWSRTVSSVEEIPEALYDAFTIMLNGRPRGAYLQIPFDLLEASASVEIPELPDRSPQSPERKALEEAATILRASKRPLIIAGAGVTAAEANEALQEFAEYLHAPVILGSKSHDVLPTIHPLTVCTNDSLALELDDFVARADCVFVVGSKLGAERTARGRLPLSANLIHNDIDVAEIGRNYPTRLKLVGDARMTLTGLTDMLRLDTPQREHNELLDGLGKLRRTSFECLRAEHEESFAMLEGVNSALAELPRHTIVVADMTLLGYAAAHYLPTYQPRTFIHPAEFCAIGCGLPLALGAKVAAPDQIVIALCGDGGFLLNVSELATAVQERLAVIIVIFNDATFATVKKDQQKRYPDHYIATDLQAPDYVLLAQAYHARGTRVTTAEDLSLAIQEASRHNGPTVIDVVLPQRQW